MKKLALFLIAALLVNVLAACQGAMGSGAQTPPPVETNPAQTTAPMDTTPTPDPTIPSTEDTTPTPDPVIPSTEDTTPTAKEVTGDTTDLITREEAKKIALNDANVKESEIRDLDIELDKDNGTVHYDVDFALGDKDYDYEIDAKSGKILRSETPPKTDNTKTESNPKEETKKELTAAEARDIALKHANLKKTDVRDLEVELDKDDGKKHFDVSFEKDGYDYEYEIDAATGKILKSEKERD